MVVFIIDKASKESAARNSVEQIREEAERVIKKQITAANKWGGYGPTIKSTVRNGLSVVEDGEKIVAIAEITWEILHLTDIEGV